MSDGSKEYAASYFEGYNDGLGHGKAARAILRAENEALQRKLHDAIVKYQRLLMQYEPEKAAAGASATFKGEEAVDG